MYCDPAMHNQGKFEIKGSVTVLGGIGPCVDLGSTYVHLGSTYVDVCRPKFTAVDPGSTQGPIPRSTALLLNPIITSQDSILILLPYISV